MPSPALHIQVRYMATTTIQQTDPITISLENRAWKGTRLCTPNEFMMKEGLAFELGWHVGKNAFMGTIYYYDKTHKFFPFGHSLKDYCNVFAPTIQACLEDSETIINCYFLGKKTYIFEKNPAIWKNIP
jgi:hypothetical protein